MIVKVAFLLGTHSGAGLVSNAAFPQQPAQLHNVSEASILWQSVPTQVLRSHA